MGNFYSGFGGHKSHLGHCEDGIIYSGRTPIGRYENGNIYNQFKEHVGSYGGGSIYDAFGTHIASYDGGCVYNKYLNAVVGREQVGSYDGNPAEAAALVLLFLGRDFVNSELFLGGDFVNSDRSQQSTNTSSSTTTYSSSTTTYSSSNSSDTGCLSSLFGLILLAIDGLLKLLWPIIKVDFLARMLPSCAAASWVGFACGVLAILCSVAGLIPLAVIFVVIMFVPCLLFWPYWVILMWQKIKKANDLERSVFSLLEMVFERSGCLC